MDKRSANDTTTHDRSLVVSDGDERIEVSMASTSVELAYDRTSGSEYATVQLGQWGDDTDRGEITLTTRVNSTANAGKKRDRTAMAGVDQSIGRGFGQLLANVASRISYNSSQTPKVINVGLFTDEQIPDQGRVVQGLQQAVNELFPAYAQGFTGAYDRRQGWANATALADYSTYVSWLPGGQEDSSNRMWVRPTTSDVNTDDDPNFLVDTYADTFVLWVANTNAGSTRRFNVFVEQTQVETTYDVDKVDLEDGGSNNSTLQPYALTINLTPTNELQEVHARYNNTTQTALLAYEYYSSALPCCKINHYSAHEGGLNEVLNTWDSTARTIFLNAHANDISIIQLGGIDASSASQDTLQSRYESVIALLRTANSSAAVCLYVGPPGSTVSDDFDKLRRAALKAAEKLNDAARAAGDLEYVSVYDALQEMDEEEYYQGWLQGVSRALTAGGEDKMVASMCAAIRLCDWLPFLRNGEKRRCRPIPRTNKYLTRNGSTQDSLGDHNIQTWREGTNIYARGLKSTAPGGVELSPDPSWTNTGDNTPQNGLWYAPSGGYLFDNPMLAFPAGVRDPNNYIEGVFLGGTGDGGQSATFPASGSTPQGAILTWTSSVARQQYHPWNSAGLSYNAGRDYAGGGQADRDMAAWVVLRYATAYARDEVLTRDNVQVYNGSPVGNLAPSRLGCVCIDYGASTTAPDLYLAYGLSKYNWVQLT